MCLSQADTNRLRWFWYVFPLLQAHLDQGQQQKMQLVSQLEATPKVWMPCQILRTGFVQNIFVVIFSWNVSSLMSQKIPNHTNIWSHQTVHRKNLEHTQPQRCIPQIPNCNILSGQWVLTGVGGAISEDKSTNGLFYRESTYVSPEPCHGYKPLTGIALGSEDRSEVTEVALSPGATHSAAGACESVVPVFLLIYICTSHGFFHIENVRTKQDSRRFSGISCILISWTHGREKFLVHIVFTLFPVQDFVSRKKLVLCCTTHPRIRKCQILSLFDGFRLFVFLLSLSLSLSLSLFDQAVQRQPVAPLRSWRGWGEDNDPSWCFTRTMKNRRQSVLTSVAQWCKTRKKTQLPFPLLECPETKENYFLHVQSGLGLGLRLSFLKQLVQTLQSFSWRRKCNCVSSVCFLFRL